MKNYNQHPYHLVNISPWPFMASFSCFFFTLGTTMYLHNYQNGLFLIIIGLFSIFFVMFTWWRDIIREGVYEGNHTVLVQLGLRNGMLLFIISELMLFFAFFWSFFHSSLAPTIQIGSLWPPIGIETINPWGIPLLNTIILLTSGATITWAHHSIIIGNLQQIKQSLILTISLAIFFSFLQIFEYFDADFSISSGIYGSTFFLTTGFHGLHVIIGTIFIMVCFGRVVYGHFTKQHHFGFEAAAWYWHFVDVIWLFLFVSIYWWGGK